MRLRGRTALGGASVVVCATLACASEPAPPPFAIESATIADIHTALARGHDLPRGGTAVARLDRHRR